MSEDVEQLSAMIDRALEESRDACRLHEPFVACCFRTYAASRLLLDRGVTIPTVNSAPETVR